MVTCGRKEKRQYKIEHGLNLGRRRKEKNNARIRSLPDLEGNSPERALTNAVKDDYDQILHRLKTENNFDVVIEVDSCRKAKPDCKRAR